VKKANATKGRQGARRAKPAGRRTKRVARSGGKAARRTTKRAQPKRPASRKSRARAKPKSRKAAKPSRAAAKPRKAVATPASEHRAPLIRKGLPVTKAALRRLGKMQQGERPEIKSIIVYTTEQKPKNLYPRKIISPPFPSKCCTDANRLRVGKIYEELGRSYYYKVCKVCGHAVKYYFNRETEFEMPKLRKYYEWKKSVFH